MSEFTPGTTVAQLAHDFDPCNATIYQWTRESQAKQDDSNATRSEEAWREIEKKNLYLKRQVAV